MQISGHFTAVDWGVLAGYLILTTLLGLAFSGKQATIRDFFLGGRKLPWYAVAGSIIATEVSAVTFISVPAIVFAPGGDFTYLQLAIGAILARLIIAIWFVPAYYAREIFSPYDYVGAWLGEPGRRMTTVLFTIGTVLGQSVRVLLTAVILELITGLPLTASIWIIGGAMILWTLLGGITTVIWTEVVQFFVFLVGLGAALVYLVLHVPGGWSEIAHTAGDAGKFHLWNTSLDPRQAFTIWTALIANTLVCLHAYGSDQMIAQRMFCCSGVRGARWAILASSFGHVITLLALLVGAALFAFYEHHRLPPETAAVVADKGDRIFPIFILQELPPGLAGLVIAGVFAAAISSPLAALAQTSVSLALGRGADSAKLDSGASGRGLVRASRVLVVVWGLALSGMAQVTILALDRYGDILNLALAMASLTGGALLAVLLLSLLRVNVDYTGYVWSAPISVIAVFGLSWHEDWAQWSVALLVSLILLGWIVMECRRPDFWRVWPRFASLVGLLGVTLFLNRYRLDHQPIELAWPWNVPIGLLISFFGAILLTRAAGTRGS